jgi:large subunit ribosomal protein L22
MEYTHIQKNSGHTPRKLRLVADMVRGKKINSALLSLQFTRQAAAVDLAKAIKTAVANSGKGAEDLSFKSLEINEGLKMKRFRAGTRGRIKRYAKRMSHIKVVLTDAVAPVAAEEVKKVNKNEPSKNDEKVEDVKENVTEGAI